MADTYRVIHTEMHRRDGVAAVGDVIEPLKAELEAFGDNLEAVDAEAADADSAESGADTSSDANTDATADSESSGEFESAEAFVDRTPMDDVIADLESGQYDDNLDAIEQAESDGRDRDGVHEAIDARREA